MSESSPLANASFRKLFSAQVIALVGTGMTTVALTLLAYDLVQENAGVVLGTALAFKMVAYVVFAPIVGGLAHRFPRKALLISLDIVRAGIVLLMPFVTAVWQIYLLIFLLNLFSAGFKPVFAATIPDVLPDERDYTKALAYSRLAYDLENLLSPTLAGIALLLFSYTGLFAANSIAFLVSAVLIIGTVLPPREERSGRVGGLWKQISFGLVSYMRTPRLRALLALYCAVSSASAMVIVNTVIYVKENLGGADTQVAAAFAAAGCGSMLAALTVPRMLEKIADRPVMLTGSVVMGAGVLCIYQSPGLQTMLPVWFLIGLGWSLVQTPAGRLVNRSASADDRAAYFSAQFALSHAAWLVAYPVAGQLGARLGIETTALIMGGVIILFSIAAGVFWPADDTELITHTHEPDDHEHLHTHGPHHQHDHRGNEGPEPHRHPHYHQPLEHTHAFHIDDHHMRWPKPGSA